MKLKIGKFFISKSKHLTAKYTNNFSNEKLIKYKNQYSIGGFFRFIYNIIPPLTI